MGENVVAAAVTTRMDGSRSAQILSRRGIGAFVGGGARASNNASDTIIVIQPLSGALGYRRSLTDAPESRRGATRMAFTTDAVPHSP
jgi:hypothetical protein